MSVAIDIMADNFTKQDNPVSTNIIDMGIWGGKVRVQIDHFTTADFDIGSTLKVAKLPVGATFLEMIIYHGALGTAVKIDVGDTEDPDRYVDNADLAAAGVLQVRDTDLGQGYKVVGAAKTTGGADDQDIMLTVAAGADVDDDIEIDTYTYYAQE